MKRMPIVLLLGCYLECTAPVAPAATPTKPVHPQQPAYANSKDLPGAVKILHSELNKAQLSNYSVLVSEDIVRLAINTSIRGFEREGEVAIARAHDEKEREASEKFAKHFRDVAKPIYEQMARSGKWPTGAFFEHRSAGNSFSVSLHIATRKPDGAGYETVPGVKLTGHAIPIMTVQYGHAGPPELSQGVLTFRREP